MAGGRQLLKRGRAHQSSRSEEMPPPHRKPLPNNDSLEGCDVPVSYFFKMQKFMSSHQNEGHPTLTINDSPKLTDKLKNDERDKNCEGHLCSQKAEYGTQTKTSRRNSKEKRPVSGVIPKSFKHIIPTHRPNKRKVKLMDWKRYHRLDVIYAFIDDLERDYPAICTVTAIGKSVEGRDIKMIKISNSDASNSAVWLDGCIHPREWISISVVTYIADALAKNFLHMAPSITNKDWYIVPVLNPDGYEYSHTHDRMWRKNRACYEGQFGVDLNRNFSYGWGNNGEQGSSDEPDHVFYRGPVPFSEPETVAVRDTILGATVPFKVFLSFHSYYELIIFPWGYKKEPCPDYIRLLEGGAIMARAICDTSGKMYKVGNTKDLTYYACGTSIDWSYSIAKIPFSYMIELRSKKHKFKLPKEQIMETCVEIWNGVKSLMEYVDDACL